MFSGVRFPRCQFFQVAAVARADAAGMAGSVTLSRLIRCSANAFEFPEVARTSPATTCGHAYPCSGLGFALARAHQDRVGNFSGADDADADITRSSTTLLRGTDKFPQGISVPHHPEQPAPFRTFVDFEVFGFRLRDRDGPREPFGRIVRDGLHQIPERDEQKLDRKNFPADTRAL
ncbi:MAG: hypothetical protein ABIP85_22210 [Chthoniobacteraceae bacterium]